MSLLILTSCSKSPIDLTDPSKVNENMDYDNAENSIPLTSLEKTALYNILGDFSLMDSIDTANLIKHEIILETGPTGNFVIEGKYKNQTENHRKNFTVVQIDNQIVSATISSFEVLIVSESQSIVTLVDLTTGWGEIYNKTNNVELLVSEITGSGDKPTWWECMTGEFKLFTSTLAGQIAMGLYPEPILGMMSAKCAYIAYS